MKSAKAPVRMDIKVSSEELVEMAGRIVALQAEIPAKRESIDRKFDRLVRKIMIAFTFLSMKALLGATVMMVFFHPYPSHSYKVAVC